MTLPIAVLGAGAWGTALAQSLAAHHPDTLRVLLWARDAALVSELQRSQQNSRYLPSIALNPQLQYSADLAAAIQFAQGGLVIAATSVAGLRPLCQALKALLPLQPPNLIWLCKGLEVGTDLFPHQVIAAELGNMPCAALSGPSFAQEVALGQPAALTLASRDPALLKFAQPLLHGGALRIYSSQDVAGVEVGGAVKNVLAVATGIADGLQLGLNARAALITRGLAEMARLAAALGGQPDTMLGLAGVGDLLLTTTGDLSRNRKVGLLLASGLTLDAALAQLGHVAEGVRCAPSVLKLAQQHGVAMPIVETVNQILFADLPAALAVKKLLARDVGGVG